MKKFIFLLVIITFISEPSFSQSPPNTYAVVVGITQYQNPAIPALQFADRDAQQFSAWLQSKSGGNVSQNNIKLLVNNKATIAGISDALDWLKEQCKENDRAYIYFAGHGDVETNNDSTKGFLLAYNSPRNNYANNAIKIEDINNESIELTTKNKAKVIIITDACHSGRLAGDFYKGRQLVASQLNKVLNDQVRIASCKEDQLAAEGPNWGGGRGVFSYYLVLGLQGLAAIQNDSTIQLDNLSKYLDSAFANDHFLAQNNFKQNPVTDGNPYFKMATKDTATLTSIKETINKNERSGSGLPPGLMHLEPLQEQPIDYFFAVVNTVPLESFGNFEFYQSLSPDSLAQRIIEDGITWQIGQNELEKNPAHLMVDGVRASFSHFDIDSLNMLSYSLQQSGSLVNQFIEYFIQMVHGKGQDMINAYLKGDIDELERRQYYYSGNRDYKKYLLMLDIALKWVSPDHKLAHILKVHNYYITGLIDRMEMATSKNPDSLLKLAFANQKEALKLEPYAAYILNEIGNLYMDQKKYASANSSYHLATVRAPTWAIPWGNKIRMNLALNKSDEAEKDFHIADSLQPDLAYVLINAGLVMEKKKNLLAAESYYLRAIKENKVHYLPYERLANIYLNTGKYEKANIYFFETKTRKKDFDINDKVFKYGIAMNITPWFDSYYNLNRTWDNSLPKNKENKLYFKLYQVLDNEDSLKKSGKYIKLLDSLAQTDVSLPLAFHFIGKEYYQHGNWLLAQKNLEKSILNYLDENALVQRIAKDILGESFTEEDTSKLSLFRKFQYDILEDRYMLATIYERNGDNDKAFAQYRQAGVLENNRQQIQAVYKNYAELAKKFGEVDPGTYYSTRSGEDFRHRLTQATEQPVIMLGSILSARLYEKLGQYEEAEKVLLHQVALSRAAGYERQIAVNEKRPGWLFSEGKNVYWLSINSYLESEIYNFYQKMVLLNPRDTEWNKKAGLFLYNRLRLAFMQLPVEQYKPFYDDLGQYAYPWKGALEENEDYQFSVPGTVDTVKIVCKTYDPVKKSLDEMLLSIKFSGDINADFQSASALADLYSWIGNEMQSVHWYRESLKLKPENVALRSKFANYLSVISYLPEAAGQLEILNQEQSISQSQKIQLADWQLLSATKNSINPLLKTIIPKDSTETSDIIFLIARTKALQGKNKNALKYVKNAMPEFQPNNNDTTQLNDKKDSQKIRRLYFTARLNGLLKNKDKALLELKDALDAGFNYEYVLKNDKAWEKYRNSSKWNELMANRNFYFKLPDPNDFSPIDYRTPALEAPGDK